MFDESGIRFFLMFNSRLKVFHFILDETVPVADQFFALQGRRAGRRSASAPALRSITFDGRKILVGVDERQSRLNTYLDGPFDQLPENFIEGEALRDAILAVEPGVKGKIDRLGNFTDGSRPLPDPSLYALPAAGDLAVFQRCVDVESGRGGRPRRLLCHRRRRGAAEKSAAAGAEEALRTRRPGTKTCRMEWTDDGIVLGTRRHGEANAIVEVMTRDHGRHLGLVRGGGGSRLRPLLQPGNTVRVVWRARLDEHLGHYAVEPLRLHGASQLAASHVVYGVTHLAALCRLLPERDPHPEVHDHLAAMLDHLDDPLRRRLEMVRFELQMLAELGFGLDLASCAATGAEDDLGYVSPKSGRAVSRVAAAPWQDRLFRLPAFLSEAVDAVARRHRRRLCADRLLPRAPRAGAARARLRGRARGFRRRGARPAACRARGAVRPPSRTAVSPAASTAQCLPPLFICQHHSLPHAWRMQFAGTGSCSARDIVRGMDEDEAYETLAR